LVFNWLSGNEKIDDFIKKMQFNIIKDDINIKFKLISYNQFNEIKKIGQGGFSTTYLATWEYKKVVLKCLDNSQNHINELLNEV
jgi:serine/threonine protein kinase